MDTGEGVRNGKRVGGSPCARSTAHGEVMSSPCARSQAHGEHGISIFHVNETCILLNFSMSFSKFILKLKTRP